MAYFTQEKEIDATERGMSREDDLPNGPLTDQELRRLRSLLRDEDRTKFFWRTLRIWVGWGSGVIGAIWVGWETIAKTARALLHTMSGSSP